MDSNNWRVKRDPADIPARDQTPKRSFQRSENGTPRSGGLAGIGQRQTPTRQARESSFHKPYNDQQSEQAVSEGRRIYVGNLPYEATVKDIETLLTDVGAGIEVRKHKLF